MKDIPQVMAITILFSFTFCLVMVLVDIAYSMLDPRVKAQYQAAGKRRAKENRVLTEGGRQHG
jgi:ABC-type dipeptide/oligopeptide/nickel transport systems, permease components